MAEMKSKHAFGSEANVDNALAQGLIDAYDVLFLDEGKIGWINKDGEKVILEDKVQVALVDVLPETGNADVIYIYGGNIYLWNGSEFVSPVGEGGGVSEDTVDTKIETAKTEITESANAYTDEQIAAAFTIVEF